jgi:hypothetical protein
MPQQTLKSNLDELRRLLARPENLDDDMRQQLADVADTIEEVLGEDSPDLKAAHQRIEDVALSFEARHPAFSRILSEVTDALAKLGI